MHVTIAADGSITCDVNWRALALPVGNLLAVEVSLGARTATRVVCREAVARWHSPIESIAKSERGLERTVQGRALLFLIPAALGQATITFYAPNT